MDGTTSSPGPGEASMEWPEFFRPAFLICQFPLWILHPSRAQDVFSKQLATKLPPHQPWDMGQLTCCLGLFYLKEGFILCPSWSKRPRRSISRKHSLRASSDHQLSFPHPAARYAGRENTIYTSNWKNVSSTSPPSPSWDISLTSKVLK